MKYTTSQAFSMKLMSCVYLWANPLNNKFPYLVVANNDE